MMNSVAASWIILIATGTKVHLLLKVLIMCKGNNVRQW